MKNHFDKITRQPSDESTKPPADVLGLAYPYVVQQLVPIVGLIHQVVIEDAQPHHPAAPDTASGIHWRGTGDAWLVVTRPADRHETDMEREARIADFLAAFAAHHGRVMCLVTADDRCLYIRPSGQRVASSKIPRDGLLLLLSSISIT